MIKQLQSFASKAWSLFLFLIVICLYWLFFSEAIYFAATIFFIYIVTRLVSCNGC